MTLLSTPHSSSSPLLPSTGDPPGLSTSLLLITGVHCCDSLPSFTASLRLPNTGVAWADPKILRARNGLPSHILLGLLHSECRHRASKLASSTDTLVWSPLGWVVRMVCLAMLQCLWSSSRRSILSTADRSETPFPPVMELQGFNGTIKDAFGLYISLDCSFCFEPSKG